MSLAVVRSRAPAAGRAPEVTVEVHLANGLPSFSNVEFQLDRTRRQIRRGRTGCCRTKFAPDSDAKSSVRDRRRLAPSTRWTRQLAILRLVHRAPHQPLH